MAAVYHTVKSGDTLYALAITYNTTVSKIAKLNDIDNVDLIYIGQKLLISGAAAPSTKKNTSSKAIVKHFGLQSDADRTVFVTWKWDKDHTKEYRVVWYYGTGDGVWFVGSDSTEKHKQSTYNAPSNAERVKVKIKPISTTHKVDKKDTNWWTAGWSTEKKYTFKDPPATPSTPNLVVKDKSTSVPKLTVSVENVDTAATKIQFQVIKNNKTRIVDKKIDVERLQASYDFKVSIGGKYKARCRAIAKNGTTSEWTEYCGEVGTLPANVSEIKTLKVKGKKYIYIDWPKANNADNYIVEYTTTKAYFDSNPSGVYSVTIEAAAASEAQIEYSTTGVKYFFRVRATNEAGSSKWTEIKSLIVGSEPSAPTTWSSTTTAVLGNWIYLYWVHNSEDGSPQYKAQIEITENGVTRTETKTYTPDSETEVDKTRSLTIDTDIYDDDTTIEWRVRTQGILNDWSPWSTLRTIEVYEKPYVEIDIINRKGNNIANITKADTIAAFPFTIKCTSGPETQTPIGYHIQVAPTTGYKTTNNVGEEVQVLKNEVVYSKYANSSDYTYSRELTPSVIDLEPDIEYKVTVTVSMDSGLTAKDTYTFTVIWDDDRLPEPNAKIGIRGDTLEAVIRPFCEKYESYNYILNLVDDEYISTKTKIEDEDIASMVYIPDAYVKGTSAQVYEYTDNDGNTGYCADIEDDTPTLLNNVTLSVYRREYDGTFTTIRTKMDNVYGKYTVDSHPALDYARYRIVATSTTTGETSFFDAPAYPVGEKAVVINWNEEWSDFFDYGNPDEMEDPAFKYSMLKIPYNIDVSTQYKPDVAMIEYIGRQHPVSYYGTHTGETATWSMEIPKDDEETLYGLRRLATWMGDVYVREPSGSGYWAHVEVTFSHKHCEVTIPVTLNITRVEGGE